MFEYEAPVLVSYVSPMTGLTGGGTAVVVHGLHFSLRGAALFLQRCRFNETSTPATHVSSMVVKCLSPPLMINTNPLVDAIPRLLGGLQVHHEVSVE